MRFVFLGSRFRLRASFPPRLAATQLPLACDFCHLIHRGLSPPGDWSCRTYAKRPGDERDRPRAGHALLSPRRESGGCCCGLLGQRTGDPVAVSALGSPSCPGAGALRLPLSPRKVCDVGSASARYCLASPTPCSSFGSGSKSGPCRRQSRSSPARSGTTGADVAAPPAVRSEAALEVEGEAGDVVGSA
jgi:hypothetical protein